MPNKLYLSYPYQDTTTYTETIYMFFPLFASPTLTMITSTFLRNINRNPQAATLDTTPEGINNSSSQVRITFWTLFCCIPSPVFFNKLIFSTSFRRWLCRRFWRRLRRRSCRRLRNSGWNSIPLSSFHNSLRLATWWIWIQHLIAWLLPSSVHAHKWDTWHQYTDEQNHCCGNYLLREQRKYTRISNRRKHYF